jgi:hypothetical protein
MYIITDMTKFVKNSVEKTLQGEALQGFERENRGITGLQGEALQGDAAFYRNEDRKMYVLEYAEK